MSPKYVPSNTSPRKFKERDPIIRTGDLNPIAILANPHPPTVDEYAVKLYYLANKHNPFFKLHETRVYSEETCDLFINEKVVNVNIRTGIMRETNLSATKA